MAYLSAPADIIAILHFLPEGSYAGAFEICIYPDLCIIAALPYGIVEDETVGHITGVRVRRESEVFVQGQMTGD